MRQRRERREGTSFCGRTRPDPVSVRIANCFDGEVGRSTADEGWPPSTAPISASLLEMLNDVEGSRPTVLDLGCGTGATVIHLALTGARRVSGVDLSPISIRIAKSRAEKAGLAQGQVDFRVADTASTRLAQHDWVLLDRVICCYPDTKALIENALTAAGQRVAFSVPESRGWRGVMNALGWGTENLWKAVFRDACRGYIHDIADIERQLTAAGLVKVRAGRAGLWYVAVFERKAT